MNGLFSRRLLKRYAPAVAGLMLFTQFVMSVQAGALAPNVAPAVAAEPCHEEGGTIDPALLCRTHCITGVQLTDAAKITVPRAPESVVPAVLSFMRVVPVRPSVACATEVNLSAAPPPFTLLYSRLLF